MSGFRGSDKEALKRRLRQAWRCLCCMGINSAEPAMYCPYCHTPRAVAENMCYGQDVIERLYRDEVRP